MMVSCPILNAVCGSFSVKQLFIEFVANKRVLSFFSVTNS